MTFENLKNELTKVEAVDQAHGQLIIDKIQEIAGPNGAERKKATAEFKTTLVEDQEVNAKTKQSLEAYIKSISQESLQAYFDTGKGLNPDQVGALACYNLLTVQGSNGYVEDVRTAEFKNSVTSLFSATSGEGGADKSTEGSEEQEGLHTIGAYKCRREMVTPSEVGVMLYDKEGKEIKTTDISEKYVGVDPAEENVEGWNDGPFQVNIIKDGEDFYKLHPNPEGTSAQYRKIDSDPAVASSADSQVTEEFEEPPMATEKTNEVAGVENTNQPEKAEKGNPLQESMDASETQLQTFVSEMTKAMEKIKGNEKLVSELQTFVRSSKQEILTNIRNISDKNADTMTSIHLPLEMNDLVQEGKLTKLGDVMHQVSESVLGSCAKMLNGMVTIFEKHNANQEYSALIAEGGKAQGNLQRVSNYIDTEEGFIDGLQMLENNPNAVSQILNKNARDVNNAILPAYTTSMNRLNQNLTLTGDLAGGSMEEVTASLQNIKDAYTRVTIKGEHFYFDTKQLEEQGLTVDENTHEVDRPNTLLSARESGSISGFSASELILSVMQRDKSDDHVLIKSPGNLLAQSDDEQVKRLESFGNEDEATDVLTEEEGKLLVEDSDLDTLLPNTKDHRAEEEYKRAIDKQNPIQVSNTLIGYTDQEPVHGVYKVQLGEHEIKYITAKNFEKFIKPYEKVAEKPNLRDATFIAENQAKEVESTQVDKTKLFFEKYFPGDKKIVFDSLFDAEYKGNDKMMVHTKNAKDKITVHMKTNAITFNLTGKGKDAITLPLSDTDQFSDSLLKTGKLVNLHHKLEETWSSLRENNTDRTKVREQLIFLENEAKYLLTKNPSDMRDMDSNYTYLGAFSNDEGSDAIKMTEVSIDNLEFNPQTGRGGFKLLDSDGKDIVSD